jgi:hypothetical protein
MKCAVITVNPAETCLQEATQIWLDMNFIPVIRFVTQSEHFCNETKKRQITLTIFYTEYGEL